jgi:molybdopterin/thiamine biosynthesis adenylyltransferase
MTQENEEETITTPFARFRDLLPLDEFKDTRVTIIGAGGIGAPCALALAKMGFHHLEIWDADVVGQENIGTQMYSPRSIGDFKVNALRKLLKLQAPWCEVTSIKDFFTEDSSTESDVVITALDSLRARKGVWAALNRDKCKLLVDPRMGAEILTVFSVVPTVDEDWYPLTLEGKAVQAPCTARSTFHCGFIAGGWAAREVKAFIVDELVDVETTVDLRYGTKLSMTREERKASIDALRQSAELSAAE